jgi:hypothetical protein
MRPAVSFVLLLMASQVARADTFGAALLPVMAPDLLENQKRAIDTRIRTIATDNGISLQPAADTARDIDKAKKAGAACNIESLACQAQMGVLLGTKKVIVAHIASDWAGDKLELRLLDALRGTTLAETTQLLPKDSPDGRNRAIDGAALRVLAPKKTGSIALKAGDGAITLDGIPLSVEQLKSGQIDGLAPGPHDLALKGTSGSPDDKKQVVVASGISMPLTLGSPKEIAAPPPEEKSDLPVWLIGGGAVLAAAAGAGAGGLEGVLETQSLERPTRGTIQATGIGLLGATAVGVIVAGTGGVLMAMDASPTETPQP